MEWMLMPLKRYADFEGRSRRKEYWMFTLGVILAAIVLIVLLALIGGFGSADGSGPGGLMIGVLAIAYLAILVPSIAVQVRRFHDQDKSGWFVLLNFIPYVGGIITFVFMCIEGTRGPNRFGPDPKNSGDHLESVFR